MCWDSFLVVATFFMMRESEVWVSITVGPSVVPDLRWRGLCKGGDHQVSRGDPQCIWRIRGGGKRFEVIRRSLIEGGWCAAVGHERRRDRQHHGHGTMGSVLRNVKEAPPANLFSAILGSITARAIHSASQSRIRRTHGTDCGSDNWSHFYTRHTAA